MAGDDDTASVCGDNTQNNDDVTAPPSPAPSEREKTPEKAESSSRVIQKTKPKSKWADISKQIEQNAAKTPKPVTKNIQSKLSAAGKIIV